VPVIAVLALEMIVLTQWKGSSSLDLRSPTMIAPWTATSAPAALK
jgi:hypothetical protein